MLISRDSQQLTDHHDREKISNLMHNVKLFLTQQTL
ncbi:hypothetical protein KR52_03660 [Synechococcus sp. KORDI-52]|nr:hypothetical protein KR52_03660 [Synechococcus sp. KORDI-52]